MAPNKEQEAPDLGKRLKTERESKGMSLTELADSAGLSKAYLSQLEAGHQSNPSLDVLRKIARALDISVGRLIGGEVVRAAKFSPQADDLEDPGLEEFVMERRQQGRPLPEEHIQLLLGLQFRGGKRPKNKEDWAFIYGFLQRTWFRESSDDEPG